MTAPNIERAKGLIAIGLYVFPVHVTPDPENPFKTQKRPAIPTAHGKDDKSVCTGQCGKVGHGFYDASNDPFYIEDLFAKYPKAEVGVWMGPSGLNAADFDVKRSPEGEILVDGFAEFETQWLDLPDSWAFDSISGAGGRQYIYLAPEDVRLGPATNYRGIKGVDRRAGDSYSVWAGPVPTSRDVFSPAPEWLNDPSTARQVQEYPGTVKDWIESLEQGEPSVIVRAAMDRAKVTFSGAGEDFSHGDMVSATYEAIRLGSEGQTGVRQLIDFLEDLFLSRTGEHSRGEQDWPAEFNEALVSGIQKYGAVTGLRASLPAYSPSIVPAAVPDRLITGAPGNKEVFRELLATAAPLVDDDLVLTSILWNSPRTKDISREWGLEFTHKRVMDYRTTPEPVKENPSLAKPVQVTATKGEFLTAEEMARATEPLTFIDVYRQATNTKGFTNPVYAVPCAWEALSMAFGRRAFIPLAKTLEVNLWLIVLGESTTGKGTEDRFLRQVLDIMHYHENDAHHYNLGALSSPDGLHLGLIQRDRKASIISNDEASDFFRDIRTKDWMAPVPDKASKWFDGYVEPSSKISLKDAKGKSALTSLNLMMWGTPDRLLELLDASQFESGFLARTNWVWDGTIPDPNRKSNLAIQENRESETPPGVFDVAADLTHATTSLPDRFAVSATPEAQARLNQAADDFRAAGRTSPRWSFIKPAIDRLVMETLWKCAALNAMYRGDAEFEEVDALVAIKHASEWLRTMMRVAESISESPYSRDLAEIEDWIASEGGEVTRAALLHNFRGKVVRSSRELEDRLQFLSDSGRVVAERDKERGSIYKLNR